jgi:hypothetical protein
LGVLSTDVEASNGNSNIDNISADCTITAFRIDELNCRLSIVSVEHSLAVSREISGAESVCVALNGMGEILTLA